MRKVRLKLLRDLAQVLMTEQADVTSVLRRVAKRNEGKAIGLAYLDMIDTLKQGKKNGYAEALKPFFPDREFVLIKAFDVGAKNDKDRAQGFITAADILQPLAKLRQGFVKVVLSFSLSMTIVGLLWLVMAPSFGEMFQELLPRDKWFALSKGVIESAEFVLQYWWIGLPILIGLLVWLIWAFPNWTGGARRWVDQHIPGFVLYREYRSVIALVGMACFVKANLGLDYAFKQLRLLSTNWDGSYLDSIQQRSKKYSAGEMMDVGYFPDQIVDRIAMREGADTLENNLSAIALDNIKELTYEMNEKLTLAQKTAADVAKLLGGVIVISIALLIFSAIQSLTTNPLK